MRKKIKPKNIYLQNYFVDFGIYEEGCTWCEDKQNNNDIEYILQSEYDQLRAENERLKEVLRNIINYDRADRFLWTEQIRGMKNIAQRALNEVTK